MTFQISLNNVKTASIATYRNLKSGSSDHVFIRERVERFYFRNMFLKHGEHLLQDSFFLYPETMSSTFLSHEHMAVCKLLKWGNDQLTPERRVSAMDMSMQLFFMIILNNEETFLYFF